MNKEALIYVAGHNGMVGSAIVRELNRQGYTNLLLCGRNEVDLTRQAAVEKFFAEQTPQYVFVAAAKVGGIKANSDYPADFIYNNLAIQNNIINAAYLYNVKKLLFLGSSCIYPCLTAQPMREEQLMSGYLESTNEWYAVAKIAGIKMCQAYRRQYGMNFISAMPTNLYGINDNFDLYSSHVLPALLRKFHEAKVHGDEEVVVWGSGKPQREFLYVDDLAEACVFLMENYDEEQHINVGSGVEQSIAELAEIVRQVTGYAGKIVFDTGKPDGMPRKLLDVGRINELGWRSKTDLRTGLSRTYAWYQNNLANMIGDNA